VERSWLCNSHDWITGSQQVELRFALHEATGRKSGGSPFPHREKPIRITTWTQETHGAGVGPVQTRKISHLEQ